MLIFSVLWSDWWCCKLPSPSPSRKREGVKTHLPQPLRKRRGASLALRSGGGLVWHSVAEGGWFGIALLRGVGLGLRSGGGLVWYRFYSPALLWWVCVRGVVFGRVVCGLAFALLLCLMFFGPV